MAERTVTHAATGKRKTAVARVRLIARRWQDRRQQTDPRGLLRPPDVAHDRPPAARAYRHEGTYDVFVNVRRWRHCRPSVGDPPWHHPRADHRQSGPPAGAEEGRVTSPATRAKSSARSTAGTKRANGRSTRSAELRRQSLQRNSTDRRAACRSRWRPTPPSAAGCAPLWPSDVAEAEQHPVAEPDGGPEADDRGDARVAAQAAADRDRRPSRARRWRTAAPA